MGIFPSLFSLFFSKPKLSKDSMKYRNYFSLGLVCDDFITDS